jgi:hypothetical protein
MSAAGISAAPPGSGLHARRCARHVNREAAARCPGCGEFFCRECVVEHDGKLLCASCLARSAKTARRAPRSFAAVRRAGTTLAAAVVLWLLFYALGAVLVRIPPDFHDGTVWKKMAERASP